MCCISNRLLAMPRRARYRQILSIPIPAAQPSPLDALLITHFNAFQSLLPVPSSSTICICLVFRFTFYVDLILCDNGKFTYAHCSLLEFESVFNILSHCFLFTCFLLNLYDKFNANLVWKRIYERPNLRSRQISKKGFHNKYRVLVCLLNQL